MFAIWFWNSRANSGVYIYSMDEDDFVKQRYAVAVVEAKKNARAVNAMFPDDTINVNGPGTVLLLRPFQTYNIASAILMKGGLDTGFTAHGHHDFMLTDDVIHKVHIGHYTFYHKSIVKQPKNMIIAEDIFAQFKESAVFGELKSNFSQNIVLASMVINLDILNDENQDINEILTAVIPDKIRNIAANIATQLRPWADNGDLKWNISPTTYHLCVSGY